ncbi:MAG: type II toxin-antitoxin system HicB family antitoxin [Flavihumibacter sp.]
MKKIIVTIGRGKDDYGAFIDNIPGIYGAGNTPQQAMQSIVEAIALYKEYNEKIPAALKGPYELVYKFDAQSLLNYYKGLFTKSGLERLTGINQKQLQHYSSGLRKPRPAQVKKIETALHALGQELTAVSL